MTKNKVLIITFMDENVDNYIKDHNNKKYFDVKCILTTPIEKLKLLAKEYFAVVVVGYTILEKFKISEVNIPKNTLINSEPFNRLIFTDEKDITSISDQFCRLFSSNTDETQIHSIKLPNWCYDENHILIDIQYNRRNNEVLYKFRDSNFNVKYHKMKHNNYFYTSSKNIYNSDVVTNVYNTKYKTELDEEDMANIAIYEGDLSPELKHKVDYKYNRGNTEELLYNLKILFWDIEVYNDLQKTFPTAKYAKQPINSISFKMNNDPVTYVYVCKLPSMDPNPIIEVENTTVVVFDSEVELVESFWKKVNELNPDVLSGWNTSGFDNPYVFNRMNLLNISHDIVSPLGDTDISLKDDKFDIYGYYLADQLKIFKKMIQNKEPSYKLGEICKKYISKDKVAYENSLDKLYNEDINKFILYSATDAQLLDELELSLEHVQTRFELIRIAASTWKRSETTTGLLDPLAVSFAKSRNLVCRNKIKGIKTEKFMGAYVIPPKRGFHRWVIDFDFSSLYPNIMCTMNIGPNTFVGKISSDLAKYYLYDKTKLPDKINITMNPMYNNSYDITLSKRQFIEYLDTNKYIMTITGCIFKSHSEELSFFNEILQHLMSSRKAYNKKIDILRDKLNSIKEISSEEKLNIENIIKKYNIIQYVYKVCSNALYGILGNQYSRYFNIDLAKSITLTGQEVLKFSVYHLAKYMEEQSTIIDMNYLDNFENKQYKYNLYGDTDSLFISIGDYLIDNGKLT